MTAIPAMLVEGRCGMITTMCSVDFIDFFFYSLVLLDCIIPFNICCKPGFSSVRFSHSVMSDSLRLHELQHARPPCPSPTPRVHPNSSIESMMPSSHLILCHPLLPLPTIPPSIRVFSSESTLHMRWPKYWSFSFSISPSKEHPGLISFRMDWLDLLAVHGTLKSLLQHHRNQKLFRQAKAERILHHQTSCEES